MKKKIAWGNSKLLKMYLTQNRNNPFDYCIDDFCKESDIYGMPIRRSECLSKERPGLFLLVIFAASNRSLWEISLKLNKLGLSYRKNYIFYSDFFYKNFLKKAEKSLRIKFNPDIYKFVLSYSLNSRVLIHTTILGSWLFLEVLNKVNKLSGQIAEVGAFQGGNVLCSLNYMTNFNSKKFYIFDSFEGFPDTSKNDPKRCQKGDYKIETTYQEIVDAFSIFPQAIIVKGFIPRTFKQVPKNEKFSLVFYDCDLYQPALDTFNYFWDKLVPNGYLLIHDYETEEGGFGGVKKATDEYFRPKKVKIISFWENTMAVIKK